MIGVLAACLSRNKRKKDREIEQQKKYKEGWLTSMGAYVLLGNMQVLFLKALGMKNSIQQNETH